MGVKFSALPAAASSVSTDEFAVNQSGTSRKVTTQQIADFVKSDYAFTQGSIIFADASGTGS